MNSNVGGSVAPSLLAWPATDNHHHDIVSVQEDLIHLSRLLAHTRSRVQDQLDHVLHNHVHKLVHTY